MKDALFSIVSAIVMTASSALAIDDFNVQVSKIMHEDTSLSYDIYTKGESADLWNHDCPWLQKPGVALRFNATHQERRYSLLPPSFETVESDLYSPILDLHFQTVGDVNAGVIYSHGFLSQNQRIFPLEIEGDLNSVGAYLSKQWNCGFKIGATFAYSTGDERAKRIRFARPYEFNTTGASAALGFARSFGEKQTWKNMFVDTSANFLYQSRENAGYFLWMAKLGHNCCERLAFYGLFNLYYEIDYQSRRFGVPVGFAGYRPYYDDTWGELGGGFQAQICHGFTFTAEATTPVLDEALKARSAFQVRGGLNWSF